MRIVHVTEALGGGVLSVLELLTACQVGNGAEVEIVFVRRRDTPPVKELSERFPGARITEVSSGRGRIERLRRLKRAVSIAVRRGDVVHLHSSIAGGIGRLISWRALRRGCVLYSPHGVSFARNDVPPAVRALFQVAERALAKAPVTLVAVGNSEAAILRSLRPSRSVELILNRLSYDGLPPKAPRGEAFKVLNVGRIVPQKGFSRFARVASQLTDVDVEWIGDGEGREELENAGVQVSGWLDHRETLLRIAASDVLLFTSSWEGLPMVLVEAQAIGVPVVAWDCVGVSDVVHHELTGFVVHEEADLLAAVRRLQADPSLWRAYSIAARREAARFSAENYAQDSFKVYERARAGA